VVLIEKITKNNKKYRHLDKQLVTKSTTK